MPEIIIANIDPSVRAGRPGRVLNEVTRANLPDKSGAYQLDDGTPITLDLSQVRYNPTQLVEVKAWGLLSDVYGDYGYGEISEQRRVRVGSRRYITVICEALAGKAKGTDADKYREELLSGMRNIPINRGGVGTQMLPESRELLIRLHQPMISSHRQADGKWVQTHYYPDYPEMSGTVESEGGPLIVVQERANQDDYSWVSTLSRKELDGILISMPKIGGGLRESIQDRHRQILGEESQSWRRSHPYGNHI